MVENARAKGAWPPWAGRALSPMLRQYVAAKEENPDVILMFRMGDFFELFFDDAKLVAGLLDLTLTARDKGKDPVPMAGVPHHAVEGYVARLVQMGHSVALCDQIEDPKATKGLVKRAVTRLVTPGTLCELDALDPGRTHYLAAVFPVADADAAAEASDEVALAFLDLLAGEMPVTVLPRAAAVDELLRMGAREAMLSPDALAEMAPALRRAGVALRPLGVAGGEQAPPSAVRLAPHAEVGLTPAQLAAVRAAAAAVLRWASHTQRRSLAHVAPAQPYRLQDAVAMDEATRKNLELVESQQGGKRQGSLLHHLDCCRTPLGSRLLLRWLLAPLRAPEAIARRADVVAALVAQPTGNAALRAALAPVRDLERLAGRVALARATPRDLLALGCSLVQLQDVAAAVEALDEPAPHALAAAWRHAPLPKALGEKLASALVAQPPTNTHEGGLFVHGYDAKLDELLTLTEDSEAWLRDYEAKERARTGLSGLRVRYNRVFGYNVELSRTQGRVLPDGYVRRQTLANVERFVTPELKRFEERALSAAGERSAHEAKLFAELLAEVTSELPNLAVLARLTAKTDVLAALAEGALQHRYVRPEIVSSPVLGLRAARHPVLEALMPHGERFVANDIYSDAASRQLTVLTGPNMAGKSTVMRQAALCCVMAQMGGFVPAESATLGVVDRLFVRVGASDNLSRGQSTFMVEMVETATILRQATRQSLVLLDEIGRGTSTFDGLSLAWSVAEHLHDAIGCRTLFATHYHELTALCRQLPRAVAMQVRVLEQNGELIFLRQLAEGAAGRSYGIEVAKLAGVPASVLTRARQVLAALETEGAGEAPAGATAAARGTAALSHAAAASSVRSEPDFGSATATALPDTGRPGEVPADPMAVDPAANEAMHAHLPRRHQLELFAARLGPRGGATEGAADGAGGGAGPMGVGPAEAFALAGVARRLRKTDLGRTTPLEALQLLHALKAELRGRRRRRRAAPERAAPAARTEGSPLLP